MPSTENYITQAAGDARYLQANGGLFGGTPTQDSQTAGAAGSSAIAAKGDHQHQQANATPRGVMGYAQITANQGSITTITDVTGLVVTFTAVSGRRYKTTVHVGNFTSAEGDQLDLYIYESGSPLNFKRVRLSNQGAGGDLTHVTTPSAGSHTYQVRVARQGAGTGTLVANATTPAFIVVEDIGV